MTIANHRHLSKDIAYYEDRAAGMVSASADNLAGLAPGLSEEAAREILAREHGHANWSELMARVESLAKGEVTEPFIDAFVAIENDDLHRFESVLQTDSALVNAQGTNGNNLLGLAVGFKRGEFVQALLDRGVDVNAGNRYGWTALHQAAYSNDVALAKTLLAAGARTDISGRGDGGTPLAVALFWGHREVGELLAACGTLPANLRVAAGAGDMKLLAAFFAEDGSLAPPAGAARGFYRPHGGFSQWVPSCDPQEILNEAFVYACKSGRLEAMEFLLKHGAQIDADPYRGTGLIWAATKERTETVGWLLEHGTDVNRRATFGGPQHGQGVTALHLAAQSGRFEVVRQLLAAGADPELRDDLYGGTAAGWAKNGGHDEIAAFFDRFS